MEISLCEVPACFEKCAQSNVINKGAIYRPGDLAYLSFAWNFTDILNDFVFIEEIFLSCNLYAVGQFILIYRDG